MINSESEEDLETNSDTDFFGSLSAFKDKFVLEAEELFGSNDRPESRHSNGSSIFSASSYDFSFPWSTKEPGNVSERPPLEGTSDDTMDDRTGCTARDVVYNKKQHHGNGTGGFRFGGKIKKHTNIRAAACNGKVENGTLLQYSALTLTVSSVKPGDIPTLPDVIDDLHQLEGADPEEVQKIIDKLDAIHLIILSLDKRLEIIDKGLDNLNVSVSTSKKTKTSVEELPFTI